MCPARNDAFVSVCQNIQPSTHGLGLGTSIWLHSFFLAHAQATVLVSYPRANKGTLATLHDSFNRGPKPSPFQDQLRG